MNEAKNEPSVSESEALEPSPRPAVHHSVAVGLAAEPTLSPPPPKVLRLEPGARAALRCGARGVPPPLVTWALMGNRTALLPGQRLDRLSVSLSRDADRATAVVSLEVGTRPGLGQPGPMSPTPRVWCAVSALGLSCVLLACTIAETPSGAKRFRIVFTVFLGFFPFLRASLL